MTQKPHCAACSSMNPAAGVWLLGRSQPFERCDLLADHRAHRRTQLRIAGVDDRRAGAALAPGPQPNFGLRNASSSLIHKAEA